MIKGKYGTGIVVKDIETLNDCIDEVIETTGPDYGAALEILVDQISIDPIASPALKHHARNLTSWFKKYVQTYIDARS